MTILEEAIAELSMNHLLSPEIDSDKKKHATEGGCRLSSGIEYSFVNVFCQEILNRITQNDLPEYHQIFYIPNLKAEEKVGYDLSIGNYRQNRRIRTMHKVINEKYCDQQWSYRFNFKKNDRGDYSGDYGHFRKLLDPHQEDLEQLEAQITPYFVINICYCIHDYRRMGIEFGPDQLAIPLFASLLRTVIVDLRVLQRCLSENDIDIGSDQFYFKLSRLPERRLENESDSAYLAKIDSKANLRIECCGQNIATQDIILSFDEFFENTDWEILMLGDLEQRGENR